MPWSNQGGGWQGGGGRGPWGQGGGGPGGNQPPDLEELLRKGQERFKGMMPGGRGGSLGVVLIVAVLVALWAASGFYKVNPTEQGVVLRFGEWIKTTQPGLNYHLPYPVETVITPQVTKSNSVDIGFRGQVDGRGPNYREVPAESLMLTGDENIIDINFTVLWVIKDAGEYLFNIIEPDDTVKNAAESAMREVIGKTNLQFALTGGRNEVELQTQTLMQDMLDRYGAGILITQVKLQKVDPPKAVIDAFRDVQAAEADRERAQNEAEAYRNDILPRARGEAEQIEQAAAAYRERVIAEADGEAQRFTQILEEHAKAPQITTQRIYIETMQELLANKDKVIIDTAPGGQGVVPYLPLPELQKRRGEQQ